MCCHTRYCSSNSAPKKHRLPALMGPQVPTKLARGSSEDMSKTPGPGRYNSTDPSVYLPRQPAFSMLGCHGFPNDATLKPSLELVTLRRWLSTSPGPQHSLWASDTEFVTPLVVNVADYTTMFLHHMGLGLTKVGFICKTNNSMRWQMRTISTAVLAYYKIWN